MDDSATAKIPQNIEEDTNTAVTTTFNDDETNKEEEESTPSAEDTQNPVDDESRAAVFLADRLLAETITHHTFGIPEEVEDLSVWEVDNIRGPITMAFWERCSSDHHGKAAERSRIVYPKA